MLSFNGRPSAQVARGNAASLPYPDGHLDAVITDPPYYDFISYDTLSQVYRAWLPQTRELAGHPLLPSGDDPVAAFGARLGQAFAVA